MKILVFAFMIVLMGTMLTDEKGPHGGRIQKVDNFILEVKRDYTHFYAYLLDQNNKAVTGTDVACDVRFYLTDASTVDIPGKPYGEDGFSFDYAGESYTSYRITFKLGGKEVSAKFESENALVRESFPTGATQPQNAPR